MKYKPAFSWVYPDRQVPLAGILNPVASNSVPQCMPWPAIAAFAVFPIGLGAGVTLRQLDVPDADLLIDIVALRESLTSILNRCFA